MKTRPETRGFGSLAPEAGRLAAAVSRALEGDALVTQFVENYVRENSRLGLIVNPLQRRDLLTALRREVLLALVARLLAQAPSWMSRPKPPALEPADVRETENLRKELLLALGRELLIFPEEVADFRRDLDLYAQLSSPSPSSRESRPASRAPEGPFVDRAAFLLDPSLLEKARLASAALLRELEAHADRALAAAFRVPKPRVARSKSRQRKARKRLAGGPHREARRKKLQPRRPSLRGSRKRR